MNTFLFHTVLISFTEKATEEQRVKVYDLYQTLAEDCGGRAAGILYFKVDHNLDLRKNVHLVELAVFTDNEALQKFRTHEAHKEVTDILREIADWQVGDVLVPANIFNFR